RRVGDVPGRVVPGGAVERDHRVAPPAGDPRSPARARELRIPVLRLGNDVGGRPRGGSGGVGRRIARGTRVGASPALLDRRCPPRGGFPVRAAPPQLRPDRGRRGGGGWRRGVRRHATTAEKATTATAAAAAIAGGGTRLR